MNKICFSDLSGEVITPYSTDYNTLRQVWNRAIQRFPIAIVYCETYDDVSKAVLWARENCIPLRIRSGGHNYEGYSVGNKVLVIDVSRINFINIDNLTNMVFVGGGVKLEDFYEALEPYGYPFPGGTCPTVGISGFALGGGWGYSARKFGLGEDSLLAVLMIDYNGKLIMADKDNNQDLFWALRGAGGGNFGVVVAMLFKLPEPVEKVTLFEVYYPNVNLIDQVEFLEVWQYWIESVDNDINLNGGLYNTEADGKYIFIRGICYKNVLETEKLLEPLLNIGKPEPYLQYLTFAEAIGEVEATYPPFEYFRSAGRFVNRHYSRDEIEKFVSIVNQHRPMGSYLTSLNIYGFGGVIKNVAPTDTAYFYRDANYILYIQTVFENNCYREVNSAWVNSNFCTIYEPTIGSYVNFPYAQLCDFKHEYYGDNVDRLEKVKKEYDPEDVFDFPQGLGS